MTLQLRLYIIGTYFT